MILKLRRKVSALMSAVIALSLILNMSAYADEVSKMENYESNKSAYLEYDETIGNYRLLNNDGTEFNEEENETVINDEPVVTDLPEITEPTVTSTVITGEVKIDPVITKAVSPAKTVPKYTGRTRADALSEKSSYLQGYGTTTATKATTTRVTTTTTKSNTKSVYNGIDVSRHQGNIDWKKVKAAGIEFVMIRAGYGMMDDQVDLKFHENIKAAQSVGIDCGVYWYSYAVNTSEALREAKLCHKTIKNYKLTYPVAFDIEDPSQSHLTMTEISNITKTFCNYLEEQKYFVSVYSYASMLTNKMNSSVLSRYDIWVAHTNVSKPNFNGKYGMWQYSWKGSVSGISGDVDLDYSYKYYPELIKKNKLNGF